MSAISKIAKIIGLLVLIAVFLPILLLILMSVFEASFSGLGFMDPFGRDFLLTGTDVLIDLSQDGDVQVSEQIGYKFKGCYHEVYREPEIDYPGYYDENFVPPQTPYLVSISASCDPECETIDRGYEIAGNFGDICDREAEFRVEMLVRKGIVIGSDVAEFHYKIWGDQWEKPLGSLKGKISLPPGADPEKTIVYFNPRGVVDRYRFEGRTLEFEAGPSDSYLEVRLLTERNAFEFDSYPENFIIDPSLSRRDIISIQDRYYLAYHLILSLLSLAAILIILSLVIVPYLIYKKYGTEPAIAYNALYEREPVRGLKPYVISSICMGTVGKTDSNAMTATLLDLIRRKHIILEEKIVTENGLFGRKADKQVVLRFSGNRSDKMSAPEKAVYDAYKNFADKSQELTIARLRKELKDRGNAASFLSSVKSFEDKVKADFDLSRYFDSKGSTISRVFSGVVLFICIMLAAVSLFLTGSYEASLLYLPKFILLFGVCAVASFIILILPNKIQGRFTPEGYEVYLKSMNFRKFMTDMTLLKRYPPASIVIWEEQLVYATLFGVASQVIKNMKVAAIGIKAENSNMYHIYSKPAIISTFISASGIAQATVSAQSRGGGGFSGGGGIGGGFGGGGGGAR